AVQLITTPVASCMQSAETNDPPYYGPYNGSFLRDGSGLEKPLAKDDSVLRADSTWSLYLWLRPAEPVQFRSLIAGFGEPAEEYSRYLAIDSNHMILSQGKDDSLSAVASVSPDKWHFAAATFDGQTSRLYFDGVQVKECRL